MIQRHAPAGDSVDGGRAVRGERGLLAAGGCLNAAYVGTIGEQSEREKIMWRAIPLANVVLRMTIFGVILGAALGLLTFVSFGPTFHRAPTIFYNHHSVLDEVVGGAILGAMTGIALAFYAGVAHRTIHKPRLFKFAFLIIAMIVSLAVVRGLFHIVTLSEIGIPLGAWISSALTYSVTAALFFGTVAKHVATGLMGLYVANKYMGEASEHFKIASGQTKGQYL